MCFGSDNCIKVLIGKGVGRKNDKSSLVGKVAHADIFSNFKQYDLPPPEILRMDADCSLLKIHPWIDAIVCDPPYGRRAQLKEKASDSQLVKRKPEVALTVDELNKAREMDACLTSLYQIALSSLKIGGRLVLLFHMNSTDEFSEVFPLSPGFKIERKSVNGLTKDRCRVLVTLLRTNSNS